MTSIECVFDAGAELGEGTFWDTEAQVLWWLDIWGSRIHRHDPSRGTNESWKTPQYPGCLGVRKTGGLVLSMVNGFHFFDPLNGTFTPIVDPEAGMTDTRFNDGKPDRQGRFWSGTMFEVEGKPIEFIGSLYRLDPDLSVHRTIEGVGCSNGLAWSPDSRTMYFADSHAGLVWAFDFDANAGVPSNRRVFVDLRGSGTIADGATVDSEGGYWLTVPPSGEVRRYDPDGRLMLTVRLPTDLPTCCEFGSRDLDILYVTTAARGRRDQRYAGGLFAIQTGLRGLATPRFNG
jgi:sugar lactone lactonase YvrE